MASQQETERKLQQQEPPIAEAFMAAVAAAVAVAVLSKIADKTLPEIQDALELSRGDLSKMLDKVRDAYVAGAAIEEDEASISFDLFSADVNDWLQNHAVELVTRINEQQRDAIRIILMDGIERGRSNYEIALDLVGRKTKTGKRVGGVIGLTDQQAQWVVNARDELRSGDPAKMNNYLNRKLRDRKFDRIVKRAIKQGRPVSEKDASRILARYSHNLLIQRGKTIAQTEALQAFSHARQKVWEQAVEEGKASDVSKTWGSEQDNRVRPTHRFLNGNTVPLMSLFQSPSGAMLMYPGDPSAPPSEVVGCRCQLSYAG